MRSPDELITIHHETAFVEPPVLVHAFAGFVDAGGGVRLAAEHILTSCEHTLIASFDVDELLDYRARRPRMSFVVDHFASVDMPQILLYDVTDSHGTRFLLLVGPEPDYQWMRFMAAVDAIVARYGVRLAAGLSAIPWPAPHTRPVGVTIHGSDPSLVFGIPAVLAWKPMKTRTSWRAIPRHCLRDMHSVLSQASTFRVDLACVWKTLWWQPTRARLQ